MINIKNDIINKMLKKKTIVYTFYLSSFIISIIMGIIIAITTPKDEIITFIWIGIVFCLFGIGGIAYLCRTTKRTNKYNVIKLSKEELNVLYDEIVTDDLLNQLNNFLIPENLKVTIFDIIKYTLICITSLIIMVCFRNNENVFAFALIGIIVSLYMLFYNIKNYVAPNYDKTIINIKSKYLLNLFMQSINKSNIEKKKEIRTNTIKKKNPIRFWLIQGFLLMCCIATLSSEVIDTCKDDAYGIIGIVTVFIIFAFFFVRNIYVRYFKK